MEEPGQEEAKTPRHVPPLQFRLRTLLGITTVAAMGFGALSWLGVSERTRWVVLAVLGVSVLAAGGLLWVIAGSVWGDDEEASP